MGVGYQLINITKQEIISYLHLPVNTAREITGNTVSAAITTWYLIKNSGDEIGFVPDQFYEKEWPYKNITWEDISHYKDMTEETINELINQQILKDNGIDIFDAEEPEIYVRRLENIWMGK